MNSETQSNPTRPIIGLKNRTPLEVFDIMCDRIRRARISPDAEIVELLVAAYREGAGDVHRFLAKLPDDERIMLLRDDCPDLTEAAYTNAGIILARLSANPDQGV